MENLIAIHRSSAAPLPAPACLPPLAHRQPPAPPPAHITRAYRLGKSETLYAFHHLLVVELYSARDLQHAIVGRMHELSTLDRSALLGARQLHKFQECEGVADACSFCFDLVATHKLSGETLRRRIADHLLAAWPADYHAYRQRCGASTGRDGGQDATLPRGMRCLDLRAWYAAVDALYREVACTEAAGLPPSADQEKMAALLHCKAGEALPCTD